MAAPKQPLAISEEKIDGMIREVRGMRVMLDRDLAQVYGVTTKAFNQAVKRNRAGFPEDLCFSSVRRRLRTPGFKVTNCDLEARAEYQIPSLCIH